MTVLSRRIGTFVGFGVLALALIGAGGLIWGALIYTNLHSTPSVPWALPALLLVLFTAWRYLGGHGWPASTSAARKALLRANPVTRTALLWSLVAGLLAIGALAGVWIVMFRLFAMPANPLIPARFTSSPLFMAAIIAGASLLAPVIEESAVRGYLQSALERHYSGISAVLLSSLVFAFAHVSQGFAMPKLFLYFLVGVTFGSLAFVNNSILPVIPVHIVADVTFFLFVWPYDGGRTLVWESGPDIWFWGHLLQAAVCGGLSIAAFRKLRSVTRSGTSQLQTRGCSPRIASVPSRRASSEAPRGWISRHASSAPPATPSPASRARA